MAKKEFYDILFNREEGIGYQTDKIKEDGSLLKTNTVLVHKGEQDEYNFDYHFYCINPINPVEDNCHVEGEQYKPRIKICNVTSFRNFAIEFDSDTIKEQGRKLSLAKPPLSAIVFSGGKSLHTPIALEEEVTEDQYSAIFEAIKQTFLKYDLKLDPQCKNPNRLTRAPFQLRIGNKVEQRLLKINRRIKNRELFDWFEANDINWKDYIYKPKETNHVYLGAGDADDEMRWNEAVKSCTYFNGSYDIAEQWQPWIYELGKWCKAYSLDETLALTWALRDYNHPDKNAIPSGIKNGYKFGKLSPRTLNKPKLLEQISVEYMFDNLFDDIEESITYNGDIQQLTDRSIHDFIRVGNKFYRTDGVGIELWDKSTLKDDFGHRVLSNDALRKFRGFINEPNYIQHVEYVNVQLSDETHSFYNRFKFPNWPTKKGEFPTTMKLLQKVFVGESENQLEIGLDWIQLLLTHPKQKLRCLVLVGEHGGGKDTFMDWLVDIVTHSNGIVIGGEEMESGFNTNWAGKHLVCLNEVSYDLGDKKTKEKIKNLITGEKISIEGKGDNRYQVDNHTKVIMATNNMYDFMKIDDTEERFHVREMSGLKDTDRDNNFKSKLKKEKLHFIYWITKERKLWRTEKAGRFWHTNEECKTAAANRIVTNTKSSLYLELHEIFRNRFNCPQLLDVNQMYVRPSTLKDILTDPSIKLKSIKMCLLKEFGVKDHKTIREDAFKEFISSNNEFFEITRELLDLDPVVNDPVFGKNML